MDRPLDSTTRRGRVIRRVGGAAGGVILIVAVAATLIGMIRPSLDRDDIRTCIVDRGPVDSSIAAAGKVVPEYEHVITSPVDSRVEEILLAPGASVEPGQPIVRLDTAAAAAALEELDDRIALKVNEREQAILDSEKQQAAFDTSRRIKELDLKSKEYEAERCRNYFDEGLFSRDEVRKAETDAERARIELRQIDESLENLRSTLAKKLHGLDLEIAIHNREHAEAARTVRQSTASSDRRGVLTWVVPREGMAVRRGDELARIADLSVFRVEATVSDIHASRLSVGLPVVMESGDHRLTGTVANIRPRVENGVMTLEVSLDDKSHPALRHNLRMDVFIVTDRVGETLRVRRGTYQGPEGGSFAFVVKEGSAVRTPVRFGLTNIDYYQVLEGLEEGDEVIISDMSSKMHVREVKLK